MRILLDVRLREEVWGGGVYEKTSSRASDVVEDAYEKVSSKVADAAETVYEKVSPKATDVAKDAYETAPNYALGR